ncbi:MAG: hypothetical protein PWQ28_637 [Candidatus Woesearchaeota archaeon]|nr:hypothetical protein [Candidatus Woesearchaeota archaeon]
MNNNPKHLNTGYAYQTNNNSFGGEKMPNMDGTGPMGEGPMTGRGLGRCSSRRYAGNGRIGFGRGFGRGLGWGFRGYRNAPLDIETEKKELEAEKKLIEERLAELEKR